MRLRSLVQHGLSVGIMALVGGLGLYAGQACAVRPARVPSPKKTKVKVHPLQVREGVLTVDGLTVRTGLNLRVANLHYLYVYVPDTGTAVISDQAFAGAEEQRSAFRGNTLTVLAGNRRLELSAANRMHGTHSAYVLLDRGTIPDLHEPAVSFGDEAFVPAVWREEGASPAARMRHMRGRRAMRTGRLCRPSAHGRELCAVVHEVVYTPY